MNIPDTPDVLNWGDQVGGQLRAALQARQQKQLQEAALARAAEQEQYKRSEDAKDRERQQMSDKWQAEKHQLDIDTAKLAQKQHKLEMFEKEGKLRLDAAAQTPKPTFEQSQGAEVGPDKAPMMTPDTPEERASFAAAPPEQVTIPADVTPSGQAINMPVRHQEDVRAEEARKQAQAIELYTAKQKAELANSESVAAAAARAAAAAAAAANKAPKEGELTTQQYQRLNSITTKYQADKVANMGQQGQTISAIADSVIANPNSATSQLTSLYLLVKNLDPDSAVREGELDLAKQTQSFQQQFANSFARLSEGRVLAPDAAVALAKATKGLAAKWADAATRRTKQYRAQGAVLGVGPQFESYLSKSGTQDPDVVAPKAEGGSKADEIRRKYGLK
jgi:hypothetical protein